jgi:uncharacterized protein YndB with AHSA1/START domain
MTNETQNDTSITTPSDTTIRIEREFDAPRELVWEAYTDPELLGEWLGPKDRDLEVTEMYLRVGGTYKWVDSTDDEELSFYGEYREIREPEVLEATFEFSGAPGHVSVDRFELEELEGGRTRLVSLTTVDSKEDRDGMLQSGMDKGVVEGNEKLDAVLERLKSRS